MDGITATQLTDTNNWLELDDPRIKRWFLSYSSRKSIGSYICIVLNGKILSDWDENYMAVFRMEILYATFLYSGIWNFSTVLTKNQFPHAESFCFAHTVILYGESDSTVKDAMIII